MRDGGGELHQAFAKGQSLENVTLRMHAYLRVS